MSVRTVLLSMTATSERQLHCAHTGLTIPECCCRYCCEAQLRRYAPELLRRASPRRIAQFPSFVGASQQRG